MSQYCWVVDILPESGEQSLHDSISILDPSTVTSIDRLELSYTEAGAAEPMEPSDFEVLEGASQHRGNILVDPE